MRHHVTRRTAMSCALILGPLAVGFTVTACSEGGNPLAATPYDAGDQVAVSAEEGSTDVRHGEPLKVTAESGTRITDVSATDAAGRFLRGRLAEDGDSWRSTAPLAAGTRYTVRISTEDDSGSPGRRTLRFETKPADGKRLKVTFGPDNGTYGVAQPLVAELSHKVSGDGQREVIERALHVQSTPRAAGAWHWVDSKTLHYRPKAYWPEHATVTATASLKGVRIRDGLWGDDSKPLRIRTDDRVEALVDMSKHTMKVMKDGKTVRSVPVTTGKPGFSTRNGYKVILAKAQFVRMTSGSIGIPAGSSESYDLPVYWTARITESGEFLHAAPWSAGSHGVANTSHGCTGMSTTNAKWFFNLVQPGDVVQYVGGDGEQMPDFGNGFGDWNMSWKEWREGSALVGDGGDGGVQYAQARLRFDA